MKNEKKINIIGTLDLNDYVSLRKDLGFYKGLFLGCVFSVCFYLIIKFYIFMFKL